MAVGKDIYDFTFNTAGSSQPAAVTTSVAYSVIPVGTMLIFMGVAPGPTSVTDVRGNTYNVRTTGVNTWLVDCFVTTALLNSDVITFTRAASGPIYMRGQSFRGLTGAFVGVAGATVASATAVSGGALAGVLAGDLVIGAFSATGGAVSQTIVTPGAGYTNEAGIQFQAATSAGIDWQSKIASAAGTETATATWGNASSSVAGITAAYRAAAQQRSMGVL